MMVNWKMPLSVGTIVLAVGIYFLAKWLSKKMPPPPLPALIDTIIYDFANQENSLTRVDDVAYLTKPLNDSPKYKSLWTRIYHARLVLQGKASAYQYYEDRQEK